MTERRIKWLQQLLDFRRVKQSEPPIQMETALILQQQIDRRLTEIEQSILDIIDIRQHQLQTRGTAGLVNYNCGTLWPELEQAILNKFAIRETGTFERGSYVIEYETKFRNPEGEIIYLWHWRGVCITFSDRRLHDPSAQLISSLKPRI